MPGNSSALDAHWRWFIARQPRPTARALDLIRAVTMYYLRHRMRDGHLREAVAWIEQAKRSRYGMSDNITSIVKVSSSRHKRKAHASQSAQAHESSILAWLQYNRFSECLALGPEVRIIAPDPDAIGLTAGLCCATLRSLTTEHERMLPKLIAHLIRDEDIQSNSCT